MKGGIWRCRIKATGEIKTLRTYDFGYVDAAGNSYAKVHVVKLEKIDENNWAARSRQAARGCRVMDFEKLIKNTKSEEARKKAAEGFAERQAERERRFVAQADALEPSAEWYDRMYGVRRTKRQGGAS